MGAIMPVLTQIGPISWLSGMPAKLWGPGVQEYAHEVPSHRCWSSKPEDNFLETSHWQAFCPTLADVWPHGILRIGWLQWGINSNPHVQPDLELACQRVRLWKYSVIERLAGCSVRPGVRPDSALPVVQWIGRKNWASFCHSVAPFPLEMWVKSPKYRITLYRKHSFWKSDPFQEVLIVACPSGKEGFSVHDRVSATCAWVWAGISVEANMQQIIKNGQWKGAIRGWWVGQGV
eukprot:1160842-Pelagomonas_calceolata.AAC.5